MDGRLAKGQGTRDHLVTAAQILFARDGYDATSTETILQQSGISRGSLYHHFPDKKALFDAVLVRVHAEAVQITIRAARGSADGVEALRAGCLAWIKLARDPAVSRIVLVDAPAVVGWVRWRQIDEQHSFGVVKAGLRAAARRDLLPERMIEPVGHILLAALNELALLIATSRDPKRAEREAIAAFDVVLRRLLGGDRRPRGQRRD
jgi:AcrR family transcriptional regulator